MAIRARFSLQQCMASMEVMDPKTDPGMHFNALQTAQQRVDCGDLRVPASLADVACITDQVVCQQQHFLSRHPLAMTVFACAYVHEAGLRMLRSAARPILAALEQAGLLDAVEGSVHGADGAHLGPPGPVTGESVRAFVTYAHLIGVLRSCDSMRRTAVTADIYDEEDFCPFVGALDLCDALGARRMGEMLKGAEALLAAVEADRGAPPPRGTPSQCPVDTSAAVAALEGEDVAVVTAVRRRLEAQRLLFACQGQFALVSPASAPTLRALITRLKGACAACADSLGADALPDIESCVVVPPVDVVAKLREVGREAAAAACEANPEDGRGAGAGAGGGGRGGGGVSVTSMAEVKALAPREGAPAADTVTRMRPAFDVKLCATLINTHIPRVRPRCTPRQAYAFLSALAHDFTYVLDCVEAAPDLRRLGAAFKRLQDASPNIVPRSRLVCLLYKDDKLLGQHDFREAVREDLSRSGVPGRHLSTRDGRQFCENLMKYVLSEWSLWAREADAMDAILPGSAKDAPLGQIVPLMEEYIRLGFTLELFAPREQETALWYLDYLLAVREKVQHTAATQMSRVRKAIQDAAAPGQQGGGGGQGKGGKKKKGAAAKRDKNWKKQRAAATSLYADLPPVWEPAEATAATAERHAVRAVLLAMEGLRRAGLVRPSSTVVDNEVVSFAHRFRPFSQFHNPAPMSWQALQLYADPGAEATAESMVQQAQDHLRTATRLAGSLAKSSSVGVSQWPGQPSLKPFARACLSSSIALQQAQSSVGADASAPVANAPAASAVLCVESTAHIALPTLKLASLPDTDSPTAAAAAE